MKLFFTHKEIALKKKRTALVVIGIGLVIGIYLIVSHRPAKMPELPVVAIAPATQDDVEIYGEYVGRVRAQQFVEVRARVEGYLEQMLFAERIRPLYEQNAASQLDLDNATAAYETAEASVAMSSADLDQAELELGYTIVRSPLAGHISERHVDLGTLVGPSGKSLLATVVKSDTVLVDFSMTALDYLKSKERNVNLGQKDSTRSWQPNVSITLADNTIYPYKGLVDFAEPQVDPRTGTFSVRAEMPNPERILLPGQFTKVKLLLDVREKATVVPLKSVIIEKGGAYIYVMRKDSTVERRFIELGPEFQNQVVVERGLAPGESRHESKSKSCCRRQKNGGKRYDRIISLPNTNSPMEENLRIQKNNRHYES